MQQEAVLKNAGKKKTIPPEVRNVVTKITSFARLHSIAPYRNDNSE